MYDTLEVRWFSCGDIPSSIWNWFSTAAPASTSEEQRVDHYLGLIDDVALGIKIRQGVMEAKQRQATFGVIHFHDHVAGYLEAWRKYSLTMGSSNVELPFDLGKSWYAVTKRRQMASYIEEAGRWLMIGGKLEPWVRGCEIELSRVRTGGQTWWTLALEASGPKDQLSAIITESGRRLFSAQIPPVLKVEESYSYPTWLNQID